MKRILNGTKKYIIAHKVIGTIGIIIVIIIGYFIIKSIFGSSTTTQYIYETVKKGSIIQTVTGSGQVSAENQIDITSEVSGKVLSINSKVGQIVKTGDLIATIDSRDSLLDLENARIAYEKLVKPADEGDVTNAQNNVAKAYSDALSAINDAYIDITSINDGLKTLLSENTGYLNDSQSFSLSNTSQNYRNIANNSYYRAKDKYDLSINDYKSLSRTSKTSDIEYVLSKTYDLAKSFSEALKDAQNAIAFISSTQTEYNSSLATAAKTNVTTWSAAMNSDLASLISSINSIASYKDTLNNLIKGADELDIKSQKIALAQKERSYAKYFIRAPFDGVIGRIPVNIYEQANSGTTIATISSNKKITNISLNEVDAVKVEAGQKVKLTFDAIPGLTMDGEVTQVDLIGTASQGVVTYNVKIVFDDNDSRVRAGMSTDVTITVKEINDVLVVPSSAIKTKTVAKKQTSYVEIMGTNGKVKQLPVTIGSTDDTNTEISGGLNEGDKIIIKTIAGVAKTSTTPSLFSGLGNNQRRTTGTPAR